MLTRRLGSGGHSAGRGWLWGPGIVPVGREASGGGCVKHEVEGYLRAAWARGLVCVAGATRAGPEIEVLAERIGSEAHARTCIHAFVVRGSLC